MASLKIRHAKAKIRHAKAKLLMTHDAPEVQSNTSTFTSCFVQTAEMSSRDKVNRWLNSMDTSYMGTDASAGTQMTLEPSEKSFSYADDKLSAERDSCIPQDAAALSRMKSKTRKASMSRCASHTVHLPTHSSITELDICMLVVG